LIDIEKRRADRLRVMKAIFDMSGGSEHQQVLGHELSDQVQLAPNELADACHYLAGEGLIEEAMPDMGASPIPYWINITHEGIREMEESLQAPDEPTKHFPPAVSFINVQGSVIGSAIQSGSPGAQQEANFGDLELEAVQKFLREFDAKSATLDLPAPAAEELAAEIATVKAQVQSPKPKRHIIGICLVSIRAILEHAAGGVAASELLGLLQHLHF
jgi:hypothetical protein